MARTDGGVRWSRLTVAGGLLAGLLLLVMSVFTQPSAQAWVDGPGDAGTEAPPAPGADEEQEPAEGGAEATSTEASAPEAEEPAAPERPEAGEAPVSLDASVAAGLAEAGLTGPPADAPGSLPAAASVDGWTGFEAEARSEIAAQAQEGAPPAAPPAAGGEVPSAPGDGGPGVQPTFLMVKPEDVAEEPQVPDGDGDADPSGPAAALALTIASGPAPEPDGAQAAVAAAPGTDGQVVASGTFTDPVGYREYLRWRDGVVENVVDWATDAFSTTQHALSSTENFKIWLNPREARRVWVACEDVLHWHVDGAGDPQKAIFSVSSTWIGPVVKGQELEPEIDDWNVLNGPGWTSYLDDALITATWYESPTDRVRVRALGRVTGVELPLLNSKRYTVDLDCTYTPDGHIVLPDSP